MTDETVATNRFCEDDAPWKRGAFVLFFLFCFALAEATLWVIALVQFFWILFKAAPNDAVRRFGSGLSDWAAATIRYLSADTAVKPFPFADWPAEAERQD